VSNDLKTELEALRLSPDDATPRRRWWIPMVLVLTVAGVGLWGWRASASFGAVEVDTVRAVSRTQATALSAGQPVLTASGYLVARRQAVVSAKIQGRLSELRVEEGSVVRKGDIIARLESTDFVAQFERSKAALNEFEGQKAKADASIQRAEADLAENRRQLNLNTRLMKDQVVSRDTLEAAESRVRIAEAQLAQAHADRLQLDSQRAGAQANLAYAQAQLDNTVIRAPFDGTVVKKMAEVGESVAPIPPGVNISTASGAIVALADLATLEMEADVSESNVAQLVPSQAADVGVQAFPDKHFKSVLRQVIPTADRTKATVMVKVTLIDKDDTLKPEMSAKVTFLAPAPAAAKASTKAGSGVAAPPPAPTVVVPSSTVATRAGKPQVFEVLQDVVHARPITAGTSRQDEVTILDGLVGGELLVNHPPDTLKDGDRVRTKK
jgi:RND family efflux transporter MFP subunit